MKVSSFVLFCPRIMQNWVSGSLTPYTTNKFSQFAWHETKFAILSERVLPTILLLIFYLLGPTLLETKNRITVINVLFLSLPITSYFFPDCTTQKYFQVLKSYTNPIFNSGGGGVGRLQLFTELKLDKPAKGKFNYSSGPPKDFAIPEKIAFYQYLKLIFNTDYWFFLDPPKPEHLKEESRNHPLWVQTDCYS